MTTPDMPTVNRPRDRESTPRLADLTADLLWPHLLRAPALALAPARVGVAFFALVAAMLIGSLADLWGMPNATFYLVEAVGGALGLIASGLFGLDAGSIRAGLSHLAALPGAVWTTFGWVAVLLYVPCALVLGVGGCAIGRMAACEFSQGVVLSWTEGLAFAARKVGALLMALLGPLAVIALIAVGLAIAGALLRWPGFNIVGGLVYGPILLGSAVGIVLLACWVLGLPLVIPAIACEGADGLDAVQRAYAYILGRPLRLFIFAAVALLAAWVATLIASLFAEGTTAFARWAATGISGPWGAAIIDGAAAGGAPLEGTDALASRIVRFWLAIPAALVWAYALSLFFTASTILYLLIRQVADGQDWGELWMPGMIEGTMAESMRARAAASGLEAGPTRIGSEVRAGRAVAPDEDDED